MPTTPLVIPRAAGRLPLRIVPTPGKLSITPASLLCLETIDREAHLLTGRGIDWGSGSGILAIAAATLDDVALVVGLELEEADIGVARVNAAANGVATRTAFLRADAFDPFPDEDAGVLHDLRGSTDFLIANPPPSRGDDGLGWRRTVLSGATTYLRPGAPALVQISRQYGRGRIERLAGSEYRYDGVIGSSDWVSFDLERDDLRKALIDFAHEERSGGLPYPFMDGEDDTEIHARTALARWESARVSPRSKWQLHLYRRVDR